jgi:hypothetical protein
MQRTSNASIYKKNYNLFKKLKFFKKNCKHMQMLNFFFIFLSIIEIFCHLHKAMERGSTSPWHEQHNKSIATLAMGWTNNNTKHGVNGNGEYLVVRGINHHKGSLLATYKAMTTRVIHHQNIRISTNNAKEQHKWTTRRGVHVGT